jgi:hypothetical protein
VEVANTRMAWAVLTPGEKVGPTPGDAFSTLCSFTSVHNTWTIFMTWGAPSGAWFKETGGADRRLAAASLHRAGSLFATSTDIGDRPYSDVLPRNSRINRNDGPGSPQ